MREDRIHILPSGFSFIHKIEVGAVQHLSMWRGILIVLVHNEHKCNTNDLGVLLNFHVLFRN